MCHPQRSRPLATGLISWSALRDDEAFWCWVSYRLVSSQSFSCFGQAVHSADLSCIDRIQLGAVMLRRARASAWFSGRCSVGEARSLKKEQIRPDDQAQIWLTFVVLNSTILESLVYEFKNFTEARRLCLREESLEIRLRAQSAFESTDQSCILFWLEYFETLFTLFYSLLQEFRFLETWNFRWLWSAFTIINRNRGTLNMRRPLTVQIWAKRAFRWHFLHSLCLLFLLGGSQLCQPIRRSGNTVFLNWSIFWLFWVWICFWWQRATLLLYHNFTWIGYRENRNARAAWSDVFLCQDIPHVNDLLMTGAWLVTLQLLCNLHMIAVEGKWLVLVWREHILHIC